jgi:ribosomal protein S18 acetylase RimI-like enzyme
MTTRHASTSTSCTASSRPRPTGRSAGRARPWSGSCARRSASSGSTATAGQVGFCRAFTDGVAIVYLADVYVHPEFRGRGLGVELVREMVENGPYADLKWILHTADAHGLYEQFGFGRPDAKVMERLP